MIDAKAVALGIAVGKQASLQHFVGGESDAVDYVHGIECRLLYFSEEILGVAVELEYADIAQRKIFVIPHFCEVKRIDMVVAGFILCHQLHLQFPSGEISAFDRVEQVTLM